MNPIQLIDTVEIDLDRLYKDLLKDKSHWAADVILINEKIKKWKFDQWKVPPEDEYANNELEAEWRRNVDKNQEDMASYRIQEQ